MSKPAGWAVKWAAASTIIAANALFRRARAALSSGVVALALVGSPALACPEHTENVSVTGLKGTVATLEDGRRVALADLRLAVAHQIQTTGPATLRVLATPDRYGRLTGDLVLEGGGIGTGDTAGSLSVRLIRSGLALVDPAVMPVPCLRDVFEAEREAEAASVGAWQTVLVLRANDPHLAEEAGAYRLVEGRVLSIGETRRTIYLNFGRDYRTDFTVLISKADAKDWSAELPALEGKQVRIRGVIEAWNGAMIRVEHPGQIETQ